MVFLRRYRLDENSLPVDWFAALMPMTPAENLEPLEKIEVKGNGKTKFAVSNWTAYTSLKATIAHEDSLGTCSRGKINHWIVMILDK